ncbi:MAG: hypothetical protein OEW75_02440 [Cyclobacteriaceae bacterium]|nr:hypothetical protein [Cyclobacteriaceae bacterium]
MKSIPLLFILLLLFSGSCKNESFGTGEYSGVLNKPLVMGNQHVALFPLVDSNILEVKIRSISDSRCPSDVTCFWEGEVLVAFEIRNINYAVSLCLGQRDTCISTFEFSFNNINYQLELRNVLPYPSTKNSDQEKVVEFAVNQLN